MAAALAPLLLAQVSPDVPMLSSKYEVFVEKHISELLALQVDDTLNAEWNHHLGVQTKLQTREFGEIVHQVYMLPWPMHNRDMLMQCTREIDRKRWSVTTNCRSVEHELRPIKTSPVRMQIASSIWEMQALPGGRTLIQLHLTVPASDSKGVPKPILDQVQYRSLKSSVTNFLKAVDRLKLAPHAEVSGWQFKADLAAQQCGGGVSTVEAPRRSKRSSHPLQRWLQKLGLLRHPVDEPRTCAAADGHGMLTALPSPTRLNWATTWAMCVGVLLGLMVAGHAYLARRRIRWFRSGSTSTLSASASNSSSLPRAASNCQVDLFKPATSANGLRRIRSSPGQLAQLG